MPHFTPEPEQQQITQFLDSHPLAYLIVGMGVGKTASCLHRLNEMFHDGSAYGALVVAPLRVANLTWKMEVENWDQFSWMKVANLRTAEGKHAFKQGKARIYTINYESLPTLQKLIEYRMDNYGFLPYDVEIWDESTKAKNPASKRVNRFRRDCQRADMRWAMTGTPIPNGEMDLFAQMRLLDNGQRLGHGITAFKKAFFRQADFMGYKYELMPGMKDMLQSKIADITLTIPGNHWPTHIEDVEVSWPDELFATYKRFERDLVLKLTDGEITAKNAAALTSKLLQFTSGSIYDENREVKAVHELKLEALGKLAKQHKPLLVACQFVHEQTRIRKHFPHAEFFQDAGDSETKQRDILERWNAGKIPLLVSHPASIGHGLNMQHGGNTICWFSLTYNQDQYAQFIARLARRGQKSTVNVYRLIASGTIDDVVAAALEFKDSEQKSLIRILTQIKAEHLGGCQ